MNFFSGKKVYGGKWTVKEVYNLSEDEKSMVKKAQVVTSDYGASCCFFMANGTTIYTPMSTDAKSSIGDILDLNTLEIVVLEKDGEPNIERIRG